LLIVTCFALSFILNALTFSLFGTFGGLILLILFGKSNFIRNDE